MNNNTSYETQAIDLSLLSVLDITKEGKVVSVEKWVELWTLVFQHINRIDAFCVDMQATLDNWHASEVALNEIIEDMQMKYASLSTGFTHYGEAPPQNPHIKFWVRRMEDIATHCFITNADIDILFNPESENAQSGIAVKEAVESSHKTYYGTEINYDGELGTGSNYNCNKFDQLNTANKGDYFVNTDTGAVYNITEVWNDGYATVFYKIIVKPSVIVDQTYNPKSPNAQSGIAMSEVLDNFDIKGYKMLSITRIQSIIGDVNLDGKITSKDKTLIDYYVDGTLTKSPNVLIADVNQDGIVDNTDGQIIRNYLLTGETSNTRLGQIVDEIKIELDDAKFEESNRALNNYTVNDVVVFQRSELEFEYETYAISSLTTNDLGNTIITIAPYSITDNKFTGESVPAEIALNSNENYEYWLWVRDKSSGESVLKIQDIALVGVESHNTKERLLNSVTFDDIDQTYTPTSSNAQSGIATAKAVGVANDYTDKAIKSLKTYANNTFAPAIKNTVSGGVLAVQDVSPVEHDLDVSVRSKNLIPYPYYTTATTTEHKGITFTNNGDGSITASGTATSNTTFYLTKPTYDNADNIGYLFEDGETYTINGNTNDSYAVILHGTNIETGGNIYYGGSFKHTFTVNKSKYAYNHIRIQVYKGVTVSEKTIYPMIEKGSTSTDYTSYISDFSGVTVTRCGKNFADMQKFLDRGYELLEDGGYYKSTTNAAFTLWNNTTGYTGNIYVSGSFKWSSIKADGTASTYIGSVFLITYTDGSRWYIQPWSAYDTWNILQKTEVNQRFAADGVYVKSIEHAYGTEATPSYVKDLMITLSEDSEFEEYKGEAYTPTEDGIVEGVKSISPNMTVTTDTEGVVIDMTYNADTKMYIDNKFAELQAAIVNNV